MNAKPTRGRPRKDDSLTSRIEIRVTPDRHLKLKRAAAVDGENLSAWVLSQCARREDEITATIAAVDASKKRKK